MHQKCNKQFTFQIKSMKPCYSGVFSWKSCPSKPEFFQTEDTWQHLQKPLCSLCTSSILLSPLGGFGDIVEHNTTDTHTHTHTHTHPVDPCLFLVVYQFIFPVQKDTRLGTKNKQLVLSFEGSCQEPNTIQQSISGVAF